MATTKLTGKTLKGVWAGVTLPWNEDYSLDEISFRENLRRLIAFKVAGIYTTGSTGEFYVLDLPEFKHMVSIFMEVVKPSGIPTQVGCCADDTRDVVRMVEYAVQAGADGLQIVLPYWMELTNREIIKYFKDVAAAAQGVPLIHYNIPRAKNYLVGPDYRRILDAEPSLIGVKFTFAGSHFGDLQQALQLCPELSFFVAENLLVSAMMLGARGSYSSVICANPLFMQTMFDLAEAHRWDEAMAMQAQATAFFRDLFGKMQEFGLAGVDPVIDKALSVGSGFFTGHQRTRPPYIGWTDEELAKVRAWWKQAYPQLMAPPIP